MGYPDIPRTQGGDPYPIIWDDAQKKWVAWQGQVQLSGSFTALDTLNNKVATDVGLAALDATLQAIGVVVGDRATEATLESAKQALASLDGKVATATKQDAAKGVLDAISTAVAARATEATLAAIKDALTDGSLKAQLSGSLVETDKLRSVKQAKMTIETVLNAQSVAAGTSIGAAVSGDGASQVWVMVNIDKQPWSAATGGGPHYFSGVFYDGLYPKRTDVTKAYTEGSEPAMSLVMPFAIGSFMGLTSPASWTEALLLAGTISDGVRLAVQNKHATDTATVTIKLVRMWR